MSRFVYYAAIVFNVIAVLTILFLIAVSANRMPEYIILAIAFIPPIFSLLSLADLPGPEERRLSKRLRIAQIKKELKELGEDMDL